MKAIKNKIKSIQEVKRIQGMDGNWNYDPYMLGLYNGIEFALSILEDRQPDFRTIENSKFKHLPDKTVNAFTKFKNKIGLLNCKFGIHNGDGGAAYSDGISLHSTCNRCGKRVMMDSQGNWF